MLFSSVSFLYYFLPVVLALYFTTPFKYKNTILLLASLFFYFYGEPIYCLLMVISILSAYWHGILIYKARNSRFRRVPLISSITISLAALAFFKYYAFFISNLNSLVGTSIDPLHLALPIGISFYTFQTLSYTIDVYRGSGRVQTNLINFATYISMFPQLVAGPIVRYTTIEADLTNRTHTLADTANGIKRFVIGLAKKSSLPILWASFQCR
jgi:alginate O-acetyltransferase complex protein AlgI